MRTKWLFLILPWVLLAESPILSHTRSRGSERPGTGASLLKEPSDSGRFKTNLSFLVWQAEEDGLEFAARNTPQFPLLADIPTDLSASLSTVDFSWEPAFKFLLGYHFENPDWDFNGRWTWYHSRSSRSLAESLSSAGAGLLPLWIPPQAAISTFPTYSNAKGTLLFLLNTVDLELAYAGGVSRTFFLTVHGGLKGLSIHQTFRVKYSGGSFDGTSQMLDSNAIAQTKCLGLGPRIGFGSKWLLPGGWSLIAEATGAFALSEIKTKRQDQSIGTTSGAVERININDHENAWLWRPLVEGKAGVQWESFFGFEKKRKLNLEFAYEIQEYWEQNMLIRYADSAIFYAPYMSRGNLALHGFSLTLAFGY